MQQVLLCLMDRNPWTQLRANAFEILNLWCQEKASHALCTQGFIMLLPVSPMLRTAQTVIRRVTGTAGLWLEVAGPTVLAMNQK